MDNDVKKEIKSLNSEISSLKEKLSKLSEIPNEFFELPGMVETLLDEVTSLKKALIRDSGPSMAESLSKRKFFEVAPKYKRPSDKLNISLIAEKLDVTETTVLNWIKRGELHADTSPGRKTEITKDDYMAFLQRYEIPKEFIEDEQEYFTVKQLGKIFDVSYPTALNWVKKGKIKSFEMPGGHRRILRQDVTKRLERHGMGEECIERAYSEEE